jgi:hypothetical protein
VMAVIANASARVIFDIMIILLVWKPELVSAN